MRVVGPEGPLERARREWFEEQERKNVERLEEGAKSITTLVTGLYGVLFGVLALNDQPNFLQRSTVQWFASISIAAFFIALLMALVTTYPWPTRAQRDNLTEMEIAYAALVRRKLNSLRISLILFLIGTLFLGALIGAILWGL
jgi:hypothetical protein